MIQHRIDASPAQMRKLMSGGAITLKPENFNMNSRRMLMVRPNTNRRIATAMRKNKGVRVMLKPDEDVMEEIEGGKVKSLKQVGRDLKKTFTSRKAVNTYKEIGKEVLPIAKGIADAGIDAGAQALAAYMGNPALAPVIAGTAKVGLDRGYSALGRQVGLDPDTPVPYIDSPEALMGVSQMTAEKNIQKRLKGQPRNAAMMGLQGDYQGAANLGAETAINRNLTGAEKKVAQKAMRGEYANITDLATDYASEKLADATQMAQDDDPTGVDEISRIMRGRGIRVGRSKGGLKISMSGGMMSGEMMGYGHCMSGGAISGISSSTRGITAINPPSSIIQLGGPFQRLQSPSMSPFFAASPQLANKPISGGSMYAAGSRRGQGFRPAGGSGFMPAG